MDSGPEKKKGPGMPKADFIMGLILMLFSLAAIHQSLRIPTYKKDWGGFYAAPGFVPLILGIVTLAMSVTLFIRAVRSGGYRITPSREAFMGFIKAKTTGRWVLAMAYTFGFFLILGHVYFYIAAFLVLFAFMATFGEHKIYISFIISVIASAAIYLIFTKIFLVPLP